MSKMKKFTSLLLAVMMLLGVAAPMMANAEERKTDVVIHKIVMVKDKFDAHDMDKKYDGKQIEDIKKFFSDDAKDVEGVAFDIYKEQDNEEAGVTKPHNDPIFGNVGNDGKHYKQYGDTLITKKDEGVKAKDLPDGIYIIVENKEKSTYVGENGASLSEMKAIPAKIELPLTLPDGSGYFDNDKKPLHIYPKNTEVEKPEVIKEKGDDAGDPIVNGSVTVGSKVPYKVTTTIKAGSTYKTLIWQDKMSKGLTYNKDLKITADNGITLDKGTDYELTENADEFILKLTEAGLAKISAVTAPTTNLPTPGQNKDVKITLTYSATVNEEAVVDNPLDNTISLNYGNNPGYTPEPGDFNPPTVEPKDKKITVKKNFAVGDWPDDLKIKVKLLKYNKDNNEWEDSGLSVTLDSAKREHTFENLEDAVYKVVEEYPEGWVPNYSIDGEGNVVIKNKKNDNPPPITPPPVIVRTYGKKFVKTDDQAENKRLAGAEFIVTDAKEGTIKYLALKDEFVQKDEYQAYLQAEEKYQKAIEEYNALTAEQLNDGTGAAKLAEIENLRKLRDEALEKAKIQWQWVDEESKAYKFYSNDKGQFEVKGLKEGTYYLKEIKAPMGYALPTDPFFEFKVDKDSYTSHPGGITYEEQGQTPNAQQIKNKKVTIPQTGGIGTLIFTVTGLSLMGGAVLAMRKQREEE